ncbi:hypothetical protein FQN60_003365 [Etheostoma spectabile]|uniref:Parvalbumin n=1 Tax=Etheostoma spectabile TaxID=54343 RepID=A0A5J5CIX8_9PERO|nr:hypothetical protein FQN60_003365 [Etheostoma spectabile]
MFQSHNSLQPTGKPNPEDINRIDPRPEEGHMELKSSANGMGHCKALWVIWEIETSSQNAGSVVCRLYLDTAGSHGRRGEGPRGNVERQEELGGEGGSGWVGPSGASGCSLSLAWTKTSLSCLCLSRKPPKQQTPPNQYVHRTVTPIPILLFLFVPSPSSSSHPALHHAGSLVFLKTSIGAWKRDEAEGGEYVGGSRGCLCRFSAPLVAPGLTIVHPEETRFTSLLLGLGPTHAACSGCNTHHNRASTTMSITDFLAASDITLAINACKAKDSFSPKMFFKTVGLSKKTPTEIDRVFKILDQDKSGFIEQDELQTVPAELLQRSEAPDCS